MAQGSWKAIVALVCTCTVAGTLLGYVHGVTAPIVAEVERVRAEATYQTLIEDASFEEVSCSVEGVTAALVATGADGSPKGYVVVAESKGYGGAVPVAVGFSATGEVLGLTVMANEETPGLGSRAAEADYLDQFVGATSTRTADEVDLVSGATISSKAVLAAFNLAYEGYQEVS